MLVGVRSTPARTQTVKAELKSTYARRFAVQERRASVSVHIAARPHARRPRALFQHVIAIPKRGIEFHGTISNQE